MQPLVCPAPPTYIVRELHVRYLYLPTCGSRAWQGGPACQDCASDQRGKQDDQRVRGAKLEPGLLLLEPSQGGLGYAWCCVSSP